MYLISIIYALSFITRTSCQCERTYIIPAAIATRFQAHQICKSHGANLVSIEDEIDANNVLTQLKENGKEGDYYWMGGLSYWKQASSKWWFDDTGKNITYEGWCSDVGQPQELEGTVTYREPCIVANFRGDSLCWHDYPCFAAFPFICSTSCESDKTMPMVHYGEFCFRLDVQTQSHAVDRCKKISRDQTLINLDSPEKLEKILHYYSTYSQKSWIFWMGLKRNRTNRSEFLWNSGAGPVATWVKWRHGAPLDTNWECVIGIFGNNSITSRDVLCDPYIKYYYICE